MFQGEYQNITFTVIKCNCYSTDHPQGGYEVPDKLISITITSKKALEVINQKLRNLHYLYRLVKLRKTLQVLHAVMVHLLEKHHQRNNKMHSLIHLP